MEKSSTKFIAAMGETVNYCITINPQYVTPKADIIWVIDRSGSMSYGIDNILANMRYFTEQLTGRKIDYRQGLVTFVDGFYDNYGFADNDDKFKSWLADIPVGGGIEPDLEALYEANNVPWRPDASKTMILITDEGIPCAEAGGDPLYVSLTASDLYSQGVIIHAITYNPSIAGYESYKCNPKFLPPLAGGVWLDYNTPPSGWNVFLQILGEAIATMNDVKITDPVPPDLIPVPGSAGTGVITGNEIVWNFTQVDRGAPFQVCFDAVVNTPFYNTVSNTAYGQASGISRTASNSVFINMATFTSTPTYTCTPTFTATRTYSNTKTATSTRTPSMTRTHTHTPSATKTITDTATPSATRTGTKTVTETCSPSDTSTATPTATQSATQTITKTATPTCTDTPTVSPTYTGTITRTATPTSTPTYTRTATGTYTITATGTQQATYTDTPTPTATATKDVDHYIIGAPASVPAGVPFYITVTAITSTWYGSLVADNYAGTAFFATSSPLYSLPANYTYIPASDYGSHIFQVTLMTPGMQSVTATDTVDASVTGLANILVTSGNAAYFTIDAPATAVAGDVFYITVTAKDAYNNVVTGYTGTAGFESTDAQWVSPGDVPFYAADQGKKILAVTMKTSGIQKIYCEDIMNSAINGTSNDIIITHSVISGFTVSAPTIVNTGTQFTYVVTARDAYNNVIEDYTGTVHFTSTDGGATLPANYTFLPSDSGSRIFTGALAANGTQYISVNDTLQPLSAGTSNAINAVTPPTQYNRPLLLTSYLTQPNHYEFCYIRIDDRNFTFTSTANYLEYDVYVPDYSSNFYCSTEFQDGVYPGDGNDMRDYGQTTQDYIKDQNGIRIHPSMDISIFAKGKWYHRKFDVSSLQPTGYYSNGFLSQDTGNIGYNGAPSNNAGTFNAFFNNIAVKTSGGTVVHNVFSNDTTMKIGGGVVYSGMTNPSWRTDATYPLDNYVWIIDGWRGWVTPAAAITADGYQCATITAYVWAPNSGANTKVAYAMIDFKSDRPEDVIEPITVSLNTRAITDWNGNAFARIKSTKPGAANVTLSMGPYTRIVTVNFTAAPANKVVISPANVNTQTGVSSTLGIKITDVNGNFISDGRTINISSSSATMVFSADNGSTWTSTVSVTGTLSRSILVRDSASGTATVTASATGLAPGTATINVNNSPAVKLVIVPQNSASTAGASVAFTVQAKDVSNNNANSNAAVHLSSASTTMYFSSDAANWYQTLDVNLISGSLPVYYRETKAGANVTITAHDNAALLSDGKGYATTAVGAAAFLDATANIYAVTAGRWVTITASVTDAYGNPVANRTITFTPMVQGGKTQDARLNNAADMISVSGTTDAQGKLIAWFKTSTDVDGSMNYCVVNTAGLLGKTVTISASDTAGRLSFLPNPMSLGADKIGVLNINAKDANGYNAPAPAGHEPTHIYANVTSVLFSIDNGLNWYVSVTPTLNSSGAATVNVKTHNTGTYYIMARDLNAGAGHLSDGANTLNVSTGYFVSVAPSAAATAAAGSGVTVTARIVDQNGAFVAMQGVRVQFTTDNGFINPAEAYTDAAGMAQSLLTLSILSNIQHKVSVTISNPDDTKTSGTITSLPVVSYSITSPSQVYRGEPFWVTLRAKDANGIKVDNYAGEVTFTSNDPLAALPSNYIYQIGDAGVKLFQVSLNTNGVKNISAIQADSSSVSGTSQNILVLDPPTATYTSTPTYTPTFTSTATKTITQTITQTATPSVTPSVTQTVTGTVTQTITATITQTATQTVTPTITQTHSVSPTITATPTFTFTATETITQTMTGTFTNTPTFTWTPTATQTATDEDTATFTVTQTITQTQTPYESPTDTWSQTATPTETYTDTPDYSATPTQEDTLEPTQTWTETEVVTDTVTHTSTPTFTATKTNSPDWTATPSYTITDSPTMTATPTVTVTPIPQDIYENDDTYLNAKPIYSYIRQTHNIVPANDVDWMVFTLSSFAQVIIETSGVPADTQMWLYSAAGVPLTYLNYDDDSGSGAYSKIEAMLDAGTYYIKVQEFGQNDIVTQYFVDLTVIGTDVYENDNVYTSASTITNGETQNHSIYPANDTDWVKFDVAVTSVVTLQTSGDGYGDTVMYLYNSAGVPASYMTYDDNNGGVLWSKITATLGPGTYYVKINENGMNSQIGLYHLTLNMTQSTPTPTFTPLVGDSYENDDTYTNASEILSGVQQQHSIHTASDVDWVKFTIDANSVVTISTSGLSGDTQIYLYNSAGVPGTYYAYDDNGGIGFFSGMTRTLTPGVYYLKIQENGQNAVISSYYVSVDIGVITPTYTPTVVLGDSYEVDNTFNNAKVIDLGTTQAHSIHAMGDADWVKFTVTQESIITIETSGSLSDTEMWLYDNLMVPTTQLAYDNDSGSGLFSAITRQLVPGIYYIKVGEYGNNATIDNYNISVSALVITPTLTPTPAMADAYETDDLYTSATWLYEGADQEHSIHTNTDTDWVKFTIGTGATVVIETYGTAGDTIMSLYNSTDVPSTPIITSDGGGTGQFAKISYVLPAGTYYVKVQESGQNAVVGQYFIKLYVSQDTPTATATNTPASGDAYEYDGTYLTAKTITSGISQIHSIFPSGDSDWVKFDVTGPSTVTLETSGTTGGDTVLYLYNAAGAASGTSLAVNDDGGTGYWSKITYAITTPGTYYARVVEYSNYYTISSYYLSLTIVPQMSPTQTPYYSPTSTVTPSSTSTETEVYTPTATSTVTITINEAVDNSALVFTTAGNAVWAGITGFGYSDNDSAKSGAIGDNMQSYVQTTVAGPGLITFWWKVSSDAADTLTLYDGKNVIQSISGDVDWEQVSYAVPSGTHAIKWEYSKDASVSGGLDTAWLDMVEFTYMTPTDTPEMTATATPTFTVTPAPTISIPEAVDNFTLTYDTYGAARWFGESAVSYYGGDAAQSGAAGNSQYSYMETNVTGPGVFSFYWKVSSQSGGDYLLLYIDGTAIVSISGEVDWSYRTYTLGTGSHLIRWMYSKNASITAGSDCGWVDQVVYNRYTPTVTNTVTNSPTITATWSQSATFTSTRTASPTRTATSTFTESPFVTATPTFTITNTHTVTLTPPGTGMLWQLTGNGAVYGQVRPHQRGIQQ